MSALALCNIYIFSSAGREQYVQYILLSEILTYQTSVKTEESVAIEQSQHQCDQCPLTLHDTRTPSALSARPPVRCPPIHSQTELRKDSLLFFAVGVSGMSRPVLSCPVPTCPLTTCDKFTFLPPNLQTELKKTNVCRWCECYTLPCHPVFSHAVQSCSVLPYSGFTTVI